MWDARLAGLDERVADPAALMPQVPSPEDVYVVIAGGSGKHSAVIPNCTFSGR